MLMFTSTHLKEVKALRELLDKYRDLAENRRKQIDLLEQQLEIHRNFTNYTHNSLKNAIDSNDKLKPSVPPKVPKATTVRSVERTHENFDPYTDVTAPLVIDSSWDSIGSNLSSSHNSSSSSYDYSSSSSSSSSCDSGSSSSSSSCD